MRKQVDRISNVNKEVKKWFSSSKFIASHWIRRNQLIGWVNKKIN